MKVWKRETDGKVSHAHRPNATALASSLALAASTIALAAALLSSCSLGFLQATAPIDLVATTSTTPMCNLAFDGTLSDSSGQLALGVSDSSSISYVADRQNKSNMALGLAAFTGSQANQFNLYYTLPSGVFNDGLPASISLWFSELAKLSSGSSAYLQIAFRTTSDPTAGVGDAQDEISIDSEVDSSGTSTTYIDAGLPSSLGTPKLSGSAWAPGTWHNVVLTRDAVGRIRLYVDGSVARETPDSYSNGQLLSMSVAATATNQVAGAVYALDDVELFSGTLGPADIEKIYQGTFTP